MEGTVDRGRTHAIRIAAQGRGEHGLVVPRIRDLPGYRIKDLRAVQRVRAGRSNRSSENPLPLRQQITSPARSDDCHHAAREADLGRS